MPINSFANHPLSWMPKRESLNEGPVYLALAAALKSEIAGGTLPSGTRLPPQRELADFLDLDFTTVTRAYNICREQGLIYGVTGRGTFVASSGGDTADDRLIDCGVVQGFPDIGANEIVASARKVLARDTAAGLFTYRDRDGAKRHLTAGTRWLARCGVDVTPEQLAVFPGAQGAISAILLSVFQAGDTIAADAFTYGNLIALAKLAHIKLVPIPLDAHGMIPDALDAAATNNRKLRGVFLMPHCANPTALTLSERRKRELAAVIKRHNLILIEDDAQLLPPQSGERTLQSRLPEETIYLAGSTRQIAPGLRATYMAFPMRFAARLLSALHHLTIKTGALDTEIMSELIVSGRAEHILAAKTKKARAANAVFDAIFPSVPKADPTAFFRILPRPATAGHGPGIERQLQSIGVKVFHSDRFSVRPGNPDSFLRVSISSTPTLAHLRRALTLLHRKA